MVASRLLLALALLLSGSLRSVRSLEEALGSQELLAEEPNGYPERLLDWMAFFLQPQEGEDHTGQSLPDDHLLGVLLRTLFHAVQRPGRSPSFLFQPQRFGREVRSSNLRNAGRIKPRAWDSLAPQFLSMATPQRFGKKK
ncbi:PREDICTED: pro-FMRFamide-related neuropeptide FF [Thamnophis sirtalis]|uniref:Pro-FMRFamide-related neuropeptide FF n=1 Tax=Thamnophis sirtalis TaxID=35019 RepID=A0A6I9YS78_9SAUR|nr:PREDICTED: pro-FMRFamide-related neuropeptide FF [Thamnophis sirtalis]